MTKGEPIKYLLALIILSLSTVFFSCMDGDDTSFEEESVSNNSQFLFEDEKIQLQSSPDGSLVSYMKIENGQRNIYLAYPMDLTEKKLTEGLPVGLMDWTYDNKLVVSTKGEEPARLLKINPLSGVITELQVPEASVIRMVGKSRHLPDQIAALVIAINDEESGVYRVFFDSEKPAEKMYDLKDFDNWYFDKLAREVDTRA